MGRDVYVALNWEWVRDGDRERERGLSVPNESLWEASRQLPRQHRSFEVGKRHMGHSRFAPESMKHALNINVQQSIYVYTKRVRVYIKLSVLGLAHLGFPAASDDGGGYSR